MIEQFSQIEAYQMSLRDAVVMVGTYAPIHFGHFGAMRAAINALNQSGQYVDAAIITPNSDAYVTNKLGSNLNGWTFDQRVRAIGAHRPLRDTPTFVDDISGRLVAMEQINDVVAATVDQYLGFSACQVVLAVGSDQLLSLESYIAGNSNRAVCVLRPRYAENVVNSMKTSWVKEAIDSGRLTITHRKDMRRDISSTRIRRRSRAAAA